MHTWSLQGFSGYQGEVSPAEFELAVCWFPLGSVLFVAGLQITATIIVIHASICDQLGGDVNGEYFISAYILLGFKWLLDFLAQGCLKLM